MPFSVSPAQHHCLCSQAPCLHPAQHLFVCARHIHSKFPIYASYILQRILSKNVQILSQIAWFLCIAAKAVVQSSFLTQPASGYQEGPKQHGGSRRIMLQPPVFLLFDDPATSQATEEDERLVAGRVAKIRSAPCHREYPSSLRSYQSKGLTVTQMVLPKTMLCPESLRYECTCD